MSWVIGVDPGETTGLAFLDLSDMTFFYSTQPHLEAVFIVWNWLDISQAIDVEAVAVERFDVEELRGKTRQMDALFMLGAIKYRCIQRSVPYVEQSRSDTKQLDRATLRRVIGRTRSDHEDDAVRQILHWLRGPHPKLLADLLLER